MPRVSEKALRPRQYVFNRLSTEQLTKLTPGVKKLLDEERASAALARAARAERERNEAARHAANIMSGVQRPDPESDTVRALERELEELKDKRKSLFAQLKKTLDSAEAKKEVKVAAASSKVKSEKKVDKKAIGK